MWLFFTSPPAHKKATASSRSAVEAYRMTLSLKTPNASALKSKLHAILIYFLETKAPTENKIHNASCEDNKEDDGAALVE